MPATSLPNIKAVAYPATRRAQAPGTDGCAAVWGDAGPGLDALVRRAGDGLNGANPYQAFGAAGAIDTVARAFTAQTAMRCRDTATELADERRAKDQPPERALVVPAKSGGWAIRSIFRDDKMVLTKPLVRGGI